MGAFKTEGCFWKTFRLERLSARETSSTCTRWETGEEASLLDEGGREAARGRSSCITSVRTVYVCLQDICRPRGNVSVAGHKRTTHERRRKSVFFEARCRTSMSSLTIWELAVLGVTFDPLPLLLPHPWPWSRLRHYFSPSAQASPAKEPGTRKSSGAHEVSVLWLSPIIS